MKVYESPKKKKEMEVLDSFQSRSSIKTESADFKKELEGGSKTDSNILQ